MGVQRVPRQHDLRELRLERTHHTDNLGNHACNAFTGQKTVDVDKYGEETAESDIPNEVTCTYHGTGAELSADPIAFINETLPRSMRRCAECETWFIWSHSWRDHFVLIHDNQIPTFEGLITEPDITLTTEYSDQNGRRYIYNFPRHQWDMIREPVRRMGDPFENFAPPLDLDAFDEDEDGEADWTDEVDDDVEARPREADEREGLDWDDLIFEPEPGTTEQETAF